MRVIQTTVYTYGELSEKAQERARDAARERFGYGEHVYGEHVGYEWRESLERACHELGWEVRERFGDVTVRCGDEYGELEGVRAWKWLVNNDVPGIIGESGSCPFTGFCGDEAFLQPLREFLARPDQRTSIDQLARECGQALEYGYHQDIEFLRSDEMVAEDLEANEVEFTEDGEIA